MENINPKLEKTLNYMTFGALLVLAIGLVTSMSILALSHILIIIPSLYFLPKVNYKNISGSTWALVALTATIILSVVFNQDIAVHGYKAVGKSKYFLFGILMIFPFSWYFTFIANEKKIKILLYAFCIATTAATLAGIGAMYTNYNVLMMKIVNPDRNGGTFGMLMNYAHNLIYFQIILLGLVLYKKRVVNYINSHFLIIIFSINLLGLYMTYTRGAWLGFLAAAPFYFFKKNNLKKFFSILGILAILGVGVYHFSGKSMIRPQSDVQRISQWQAAMYAYKERPVLGYGYLNFENYSQVIKLRYNLRELKFVGHAHNNFFEMLASTGSIGFLAFVVWLIFWFVEMFKRDDIIGRIGVPFIICFIVGGLTQSTISLGINLFFVMAAFALSQVKKDYFQVKI